MVSLPSCCALAGEHDLFPPAMEKPLSSRPLGMKLVQILGCLGGSRSSGRWSAQGRHTQFVSGYQPGSPLALVCCVVLASLPTRLLMVLWYQHICHCSPSHCSGKYQTSSPDLSKCQVLLLISFFRLSPTNLSVRSSVLALRSGSALEFSSL